MKAILSEAGFPIVEYSDVGLTEADAIELFVWPAMQIYFSFYPKILKSTYPISGAVNIAFPDPLVYGVANARVALNSTGQLTSYNPLHYNGFRQAVSAGRRGDPYNTPDVRIAEESAAMSLISLRKAGNFDVDTEARTLTGYSNVTGQLIVSWAKYSESFSSVKFIHQQDVIAMARANALRFFGMLRNQQDPNSGVALNGEQFITRADQIEEKITEKWHMATKVVVLR